MVVRFWKDCANPFRKKGFHNCCVFFFALFKIKMPALDYEKHHFEFSIDRENNGRFFFGFGYDHDNYELYYLFNRHIFHIFIFKVTISFTLNRTKNKIKIANTPEIKHGDERMADK